MRLRQRARVFTQESMWHEDEAEKQEADKMVCENNSRRTIRKSWNWVVTLSIIVTCLFVPYEAAFCNEGGNAINQVQLAVIYICDIIFVADIILHFHAAFVANGAALYKKGRRKTFIVAIVLDLMSAFPTDLFVFIIHSSTPGWHLVGQLRMNRLLRFYKIPLFFDRRESDLSSNATATRLMKYTAICVVVTHVVSCGWYALSCDCRQLLPHCQPGSWTSQTDFNITTMGPLGAYVISLYWGTATVTSTGYGDVKSATVLEKWYSIAAMLVGIGVFFGMLLEGMTSLITISDARRARYLHKLAVIRSHMDEMSISESLKSLVSAYYSHAWERQGRPGKHLCLFSDLPSTFQAEVAYIINKDIISKAPIFQAMSPSFLRKLSLHIEPEFYLPGQTIVSFGEVGHSMYFILRGEVEVVGSDGDVMGTLNQGAVFGEVYLVFSVVRTHTIRAKSHCEIAVLKKKKLLEVLSLFPSAGPALYELAEQRFRKAEKNFRRQTMTMATSCMNIKQRLAPNRRSSIHIPAKLRSFSVVEMPKVNLSAVSLEKEESNMSVSSKRGDIWHVLHGCYINPNCRFSKVWKSVVVIVTIIISFLYPSLAIFTTNDWHTEDIIIELVLTYLLDMVLIVDIVIMFKTAVHTPHGLLLSLKAVQKVYIENGAFFLDLLAVLPVEVFCVLGWQQNHWLIFRILRLNRLIKFWKVPHYFHTMEKGLEWSLSTLRTLKLSLYICLLTHWCACLWYLGACSVGNGCSEGSWITTNQSWSDLPLPLHYLLSLYWAAVTMTSTGYGDITAQNATECLLSVVVMLVGLLLYGYCVAIIAALLANADVARVVFQEKLFAIKQFMAENQQTPVLQERVINYMSILWGKYRGSWIPSFKPLIHDLPAVLQEDIGMEEVGNILKEAPLFRYLDLTFLKMVASRVVPYHYSPGEVVIYCGDVGNEMYFVRRGHCEVLSQDLSQVLATVYPGDCFGEMGMLFKEKRTATVRAVTHCELLMLTKPELDHVLHDFPTLLRQFQDILNNETLLKELRQKAHMHENKEEQKPTRCPEQQVTAENSKSVKVFKKVMGDGTPNVEYLHSFQMATPLTRIAACLLMNWTFLPSGQLLKVWECLHVLVSVATAIVLPIQGAFFYKSILGWVITYTLDVLSWIAMYIGLHTAYYNKKGCLVSHPLATAKHYFTTNFLLDLSAVLPLEAIPFCLGYQDLNYLVFLRLNRMINIYHLSLAFSHLEQDIRREVGIIRTMKFILYIIIFMNWLTCGLFMISCPPEILGIATKDTLTTGHHCIEGSWVLRTLTANESSIWSLYLTSLYWATATSVSVGYGDIAAETDLEVAAAVVISIVGVVFFGYVIASVFAGLVNADAQRARFQEKLCAVQTFMKDQEVSAGLQRRIINHYEYVWTRSRGVDPRSLFDGLPLSLWGDVTYSLYKDMIVKVALFENADVGFVKMLSRCIKPVLFLKGEYIVRKHDIGSEMFFIHHGAVDVVSEDGDTVFDTMNAGRFFGEIALLFSCPRTASIRAHTNCHLFVLSKADLDEVLIYYPDINQQVMITAEKRRIKAKQRSALQLRTEHVQESITSAGISGVCDNQEGKSTAFGPHSDFAEIEFKATKTQKVTVGKGAYCRKTSGQGSPPRREAPHPENTALHTNTDSESKQEASHPENTALHENTDGDSSQEAVAGTSQATVDVNSIEILYNSEPACRENVSSNHVTTPERNVSGCAWCWTSWNDFTINPHGHFGTVFSWLTLFCTVLSWWTILFEACYQDHELALFAVNILIDAFFWLEIYIKSHLSFHDETGHLIDAAVIVRQSYVRRPSGLLLDAIAACPIEVVVLALPREQWVSMWSYLRLLHLLRLVKVHQFFAAWEKELNVSMLTVRLWKSMIVLFVTLHICSCLWYVVACPGGVCGPNTWAHLAGFQDHTVSSIERYCNCVYWCVATVTSTGYGDISAHTNIEMVVSIVVMLIGKILFGYILGTIASSQANAARTTVAYREKVAVIKDELADLNVPPHLKDQVVNYYHYQWQRKKGVDLRSLMVDCPYTLQSELALQICQPMFTGEKQLSLFKDIPDALKRELALKVQLKFFVPDVQVVQKGDVNSSAFYILKGEIALEGDQLDSLGSGSVIGEVNLILDDPKPAVVTYVAKSHVDILVLAKSDLDTVLGHFPAVRNTMEHIAEQKFRLPRNSDHRRPSSAVFLKVPSKTWEMHL